MWGRATQGTAVAGNGLKHVLEPRNLNSVSFLTNPSTDLEFCFSSGYQNHQVGLNMRGIYVFL